MSNPDIVKKSEPQSLGKGNSFKRFIAKAGLFLLLAPIGVFYAFKALPFFNLFLILCIAALVVILVFKFVVWAIKALR